MMAITSSTEASPQAAADVEGASTAELDPFQLPSLEELDAAMRDPKTSIVTKMSLLFSIRSHGGPEAMALIVKALEGEKESVLFRHEAAYVLGQLGVPAAADVLEALLLDKTEDEMVRHEAAEALSALGCDRALPTISQVREDESEPAPVRETCELAEEALRMRKCAEETAETAETGAKDLRDPQFNTVDPSAPYPQCTEADFPWLAAQLMNDREKLSNRYRALFTLRNFGSPAALAAVSIALATDHSSALLRHEVAFVLGQLRLPTAEAGRAAETGEAAKRQVETAETGEMMAKTKPETAETTGAKEKTAATRDPRAALLALLGPVETVEKSPSQEAVALARIELAERSDSLEKNAARIAAAALFACLCNETEHSMARHEAALALGSLAASPEAATVAWANDKSLRDAIVDTLQRHRTDQDRVVSESCLVGLDSMQEELGVQLGAVA